MAYGDFKDLARRTASNKVFDKNSKGSGTNNENKQNEQLSEELHKLIVKKFTKRRVYSSFKDNICSAGLADMQLISKFNKGTRFFIMCH